VGEANVVLFLISPLIVFPSIWNRAPWCILWNGRWTSTDNDDDEE